MNRLIMAIVALFLGGGVLLSASLVSATTPLETGDLNVSSTTGLSIGSVVDLDGGGFKPGATVALTIESDPVSLGSVSADATGAISTSVTIPAGLPAGDHTIKATGDSETGTLVLSQGVTLASAATFYENCDAARAAGATPIQEDEPGYRIDLDENRNGVACESDSNGTTSGSSNGTNSSSSTGTNSGAAANPSSNSGSLGTPPNELAFTGTSTGLLFVMAAALLGAGGLLFAINRRQNIA